MEFDLDICAVHGNTLAGLLDGNVAEDLRHARIRNYGKLDRVAPKTMHLTHKVFDLVGPRRRWGLQMPIGTDISWRTFTAGRRNSSKSGHSIGSDQSFSLNDLRKSFLGQKFAYGYGDSPLTFNDEYGRPSCQAVRHIRIDVDQDRSWWDSGNSKLIIEDARKMMAALVDQDMQAYAFRTGGRGIQFIIPFAREVPHSVASLVAHQIKDILRLSATPSAIDKSNMEGILRMPGGIHAETDRIGLFIDLEAGCLYPLEHQEELFVESLRLGGEIMADMNQVDAAVLALKAIGIEAHECVDATTFGNIMSSPVLLKTATLVNAPITVIPTSASHHARMGTMSGQPIPNRNSEWAKRMWNEELVPGRFYDWLIVRNGIYSAHKLFGSDGKDRLLTKIASEPANTADQQKVRARNIEFYWNSRLPYWRSESRESDTLGKVDPVPIATVNDANQVVEQIAVERRMHRNHQDGLAIFLALCLDEIENSNKGVIQISRRGLSDLLLRRTGIVRGRNTINRFISTLVEGVNGVPVLRDLKTANYDGISNILTLGAYWKGSPRWDSSRIRFADSFGYQMPDGDSIDLLIR